MPPKSPEKSLIKGHHKRMQSLQHSTSRDFNDYVESRSPERAPRTPSRDDLTRSPQKSGYESSSGKESPRPSSRYGNKAGLSDSPTILNIPNLPGPLEMPLPSSSTSSLRTPQSFDALSSQILNITSIATNLQKELSQLSRRSKDNATDLVSLKEATNARDEDIRKSLRELMTHVNKKLDAPRGDDEMPRSPSHTGSYFLDSKPHNAATSPNARKGFSLPRIPSPNSFATAMDRELTASPMGSMATDGSASIALLEKVLREMGTKEGQDSLLSAIAEIKARPDNSAADSITTKKLQEILDLIKESSGSMAVVRSQLDASPKLDFPQRGGIARATSQESGLAQSKAAEAMNGEMMKILQRVNKSVAEGGGLTNEVKALVRELRGEVLGMGRDIARRLEQAESVDRAVPDAPAGASKEDMADIVEAALVELQDHFDKIMQKHQNTIASSIVSQPSLGHEDVMDAVRNALAEFPFPQPAPEVRGSGLEKDEILEAVREAWETYKPDIELQNFGLERDEILDCLREGFKSHEPKESDRERSISYEDVLDAVGRGLTNYQPPPVEVPPSLTRDEVLECVRECLETFQFPAPPLPESRGPEISRDEVLEAVREGLAHQSSEPREIEFNREDLFDAIRAGFEGNDTPLGGVGHQVLDQLNELVEGMRSEFKQYSAANGRDTEQVLDAIKDGLEALRTDIEGYVDRSGSSREIVQSGGDAADTEAILGGMKDNLEVLRAEIESYVDRAADVTGKDEIIDSFKEGLKLLHMDLEKCIQEQPRSSGGNFDMTEMLDAMEKEFEHLRSTISTLLLRGAGGEGTDKDEILDAIRELADSGLGSNVSSDMSGVKEDIIEAINRLHESNNTALAPVNDMGSVKAEILEAISAISLAERSAPSGGDTGELVKAVKEEFEHMREALASTMVQGGSVEDKEEIIQMIRTGLDEIRNDSPRNRDGAESIMSTTSEILEAFNDGVDALRADMDKILNKNIEIDMSTNYEILDTLKEGISGLKADIEQLHSAHREFEETSTIRGREVMLAEETKQTGIRDDIEGLKVLITQMRIKIEAMETMAPPVPEPTEDALRKDDLTAITTTLAELQTNLNELAAREPPAPPAPTASETVATKEDIDAIETLVRNSKARLDELVIPETIAQTESVELVEAAVRDVKDVVEEFATHMKTEGFMKSDFSVVEEQIAALTTGLEELPDKIKASEDEENKISRTDIEAIQALCLEAKEKIEGLALPDPETLPTVSHVEAVGDLIREFREHIEAENELTAQAFEARKIEHGGLANKIEDVKTLLDDLRDELKGKIEGSEEGLTEIGTKLDGIVEAGTVYATSEAMKELSELVGREFERIHGAHEATKLETEERDAGLSVKHDETKAGIVLDLTTKLEEKFSDLMLKYDEAQTAAEAKIAAFEEKDTERLEVLTTTKEIADELKTTIEGLSTSVADTTQQISADSKTVFERVEECHNKVSEMHSDAKAEHELIREEIRKTIPVIEAVETQLKDMSPQLLEAVKEVLAIVGQHYEHSQKTADEVKTQFTSIPSMLPALPAPPVEPEKFDDSQIREKLDAILESKYDDAAVHEKLDSLREVKIDDAPIHEKLDTIIANKYDDSAVHERLATIMESKYDDAAVHTKLDGLMEHAVTTKDSLANLDKIEAIHQQMTATASELSEMVATQTRLMAEHHESKAREAQEAAIALEKRQAQKEVVENDIVRLNEERELLRAERDKMSEERQLVREERDKFMEEMRHEKERLREEKAKLDQENSILQEEKAALMTTMASLRNEKDELAKKQSRLGKEVSALETALGIRKEELEIMEDRAETLERRILEGVLDHARSVLLSRPGSTISGGDRKMNLKRVPSTASTSSTVTRASTNANGLSRGNSVVSSGIGMALKRRTPLNADSGTSNRGQPKERRILSLSGVSGNKKPNHERSLVLAPNAAGTLANLKRSHSVKSQSTRRSSWTSRTTSAVNKENEPAIHEDEESEGEVSDAGTERRSSYTGTALSGSRRSSYTGTERRTSYTGTYTESDLTYGTGSVMTGTETERRSSYASSINPQINGEDGPGEQDSADVSVAADDDDDEGAETETGETVTEKEKEEESPPQAEEDEPVDEGHAQTMSEMQLFEPEPITPDLMRKYEIASDSGLGADIPTAAIEGVLAQDTGYFQ